jgi:hypothetical protein
VGREGAGLDDEGADQRQIRAKHRFGGPARAIEMKLEEERWRGVAREWFAKDVAATPCAGKLHWA